ncbi:hypothetical protein [Paracoccus ravus]|uniref:hypothetical protein n=1 Tax=Paracoccus ravus TaxID=2447760 RepID=UPI00142F923A|nr:hypothetical protein [Paracoccus ravus]
MAQCIDCGRKIGILDSNQRGRCADCGRNSALSGLSAISLPKYETAQESREAARDRKIAAVLLTTETASDLRIVKRLDVVPRNAPSA